jgi:hypothetical protein
MVVSGTGRLIRLHFALRRGSFRFGRRLLVRQFAHVMAFAREKENQRTHRGNVPGFAKD